MKIVDAAFSIDASELTTASGRVTHRASNRSANYAHFNSVFGDSGDVCLLAHNETRKTGRASALYRLVGGRVVEVRDDPIAPAADLVPEDPEPSRPPDADRTFRHGLVVWQRLLPRVLYMVLEAPSRHRGQADGGA